VRQKAMTKPIIVALDVESAVRELRILLEIAG
jgi:hypothetical protein